MGTYVSNFRQGDTKKLKIAYGDGKNITGYTHMFTIRADFDIAVPFIAQVKSIVGEHLSDEPLNGVAFLELSSTQSAGIPPGDYVYDVQRVKPNGANPVDVLTLAPPVDAIDDSLVVLEQVTLIVS